MTDRCVEAPYDEQTAPHGVDRWRSTGKEVLFDPNTTDAEEEELDQVALYTPAPSQALYPRPWACADRRFCTRIRWKDGADCWPYGKTHTWRETDGYHGKCRTASFFYPADHDRPLTCGLTCIVYTTRGWGDVLRSAKFYPEHVHPWTPHRVGTLVVLFELCQDRPS